MVAVKLIINYKRFYEKNSMVKKVKVIELSYVLRAVVDLIKV